LVWGRLRSGFMPFVKLLYLQEYTRAYGTEAYFNLIMTIVFIKTANQ